LVKAAIRHRNLRLDRDAPGPAADVKG
jgi:hypothetical protein